MKIPELVWSVEPEDYDDDLLINIKSGSVTLLIRGRNAWHSRWVRHYLQNSTLYTDVWSARLGAEDQRGRGNVFEVVEAPALLLVGEKSHVVLADAHPDNPFGSFRGFDVGVHDSPSGSWVDGLFPGVSVRDAVEAFAHDSGHWAGPQRSEHSLRTGMLAERDTFDTTSHSLQAMTSEAVGVNYLLKWHATQRRYTRRGANAVARRWAQLTEKVASSGQEERSERARLLQSHRDSVLQATPRSQWVLARAEVERQRAAARSTAWQELLSAYTRCAELEERLADAEAERNAAAEARTAPATTSARVRKQRERFEAATAAVAELSSDLEKAEQDRNDRSQHYEKILER